MKRKISISTFEFQMRYSDKESLRFAKQIGADAVDFDLTKYSKSKDCIYAKSDAEIAAYFADLKAYADQIDIEIGQTHGRITGFKNNKDEDDLLIEDARIDCMVTAILGAPCCVVHSVTTIYMGPDADPELMHALNEDMFLRILPYAKQYNVVIASETFGNAGQYNCCDFFGNMREFLACYNNICAIGNNAQYFKTCVDTGHSNMAMVYNNPTPADVIRQLGNSVAVLHLHDNDTQKDQHKMPMTGTIDWNDVFDALDQIGYSGNYNLELILRHFGADFMIEEAEFAVKAFRHFLNSRYGL